VPKDTASSYETSSISVQGYIFGTDDGRKGKCSDPKPWILSLSELRKLALEPGICQGRPLYNIPEDYYNEMA
jgi:hypothetical protein